MKRNSKSQKPMESMVRRDKRLRHGLDSQAVKMYRILDRDVRNCEEPTREMYDLLGMALVTALHTVSDATDVTDRDSWARYTHFLFSISKTRELLGKRGKENFQRIMAQRS